MPRRRDRNSPGLAAACLGAVVAVCTFLPTTTAAAADSGSWTIVTSPDETPVQWEVLNAVSCTSTTFCMAVGDYAQVPEVAGAGGCVQTLIEEWNGSSWAIVPSPSPSQLNQQQTTCQAVGNYLSGVSCTSASFCVAVGYELAPQVVATLVEQWDGSAWNLVTSPSPSSDDNHLNAVSCVSSTFCIAAGDRGVRSQGSGSGDATLAEAWNGSSWSTVASSDADRATHSYFNGVSCTATSFCMADGWTTSDFSSYSTLVARWDGAAWTLQTSPNTAAPDNYLYGLSCTSPSFCAAVGSTYQPSPSSGAPLVEQWDGSSWRLVAVPSSSGQGTSEFPTLYGISCVDAGLCMAAGDYYNGSVGQTLIEQWDGSDWRTVSSPNTSATAGNALYGVDCATSVFCFATGADNTVSTPAGAISQTLVEEWQDQPQAVVPETPWTPGLALAAVFLGAGAAHRRRHQRRPLKPC